MSDDRPRPYPRAARLRAAARAARQARDWTARRDDRIRDLVAAGVPGREVARAVGMTHTAVQYICRTRPADDAAGYPGGGAT